MSETENETLPEYFKRIDQHFIGMKKASNDHFSYKSTDVLVQTTWELPVVVQWPDAVVNYEFSSQQGDIWFGVLFVAAPSGDMELSENLDVEAVEELARVPSGTEVIKGSFELQCEGVIFFLWDNSFDWSSTKSISYKIEVIEPSFTLPDKIRSTDSLPEMREVSESLDYHLNHLADATDSLEHNIANIKFLEDQVMKLQQKLEMKKKESNQLHQEIVNLEECSKRPSDLSLGLRFRTLNKAATKHILQYLRNEPAVHRVCTYWRHLLTATDEDEAVKGRNQPKYPKIPKSERLKMIDLIRRNEKTRSRDEDIDRRILLSKSHSVATSEEEVTTLKQISVIGSNTDNKPTVSPSDDSSSVSSLEKPGSPVPVKIREKDNKAQTSPEKEKTSKFEKPRKLEPTTANNNTNNPPNTTNNKDEGEEIPKQASKLSPHPPTATIPSQGQGRPISSLKISAKDGGRRPSSKTPTPTAASGGERRLQKIDSKLLENVQKIRSEQQLTSIMEYLQVGFAKIDKLSLEKRKIKKLIKAWNATYQKQFGHIPSSSERRGHLRELYEDYHKVTLALKIKRHKLNELMMKVGMTEQIYEEIRNGTTANW